MRICRFTLKSDASASPRLGVADDAGIHDVTEVAEALPALHWPLPRGDQLIANLANLRPKMEALAEDAPAIALDDVNLLSPVANPSKFICGAGNWKHHGAPFGMVGFMGRAATALAGPGDGIQIRWPDRVSLHEPELAIIVGKECVNVSIEEALDHVAGYACAFDTTLQPEREDWAFCKSFDTFGTLGPWLVTTDEIPDPSALSYRFWVDDELRGERSFADLTGSPAEMVAFASTSMTLYPGDILMSGGADTTSVKLGETLKMTIPEIGTMTAKVEVSKNAREKAWGS